MPVALSGITSKVREMRKPQKVICDSHSTRSNERSRSQRDERPMAGEVLQIYNVADDRERRLEQGERIRDIEQRVQSNDSLEDEM